MIAVLAAGALLGAGIWLLLRACVEQPRSLGRDLARLQVAAWRQDASPPTLKDRAVRLAIRLGATGGNPERIGTDLELTGRNAERLAVERCLAALALGCTPLLMALMLESSNLAIAPALVATTVLTLAVAGWFIPVLALRSEAARLRRTARHAMSAYLDIVAVLLAGGHGATGALVQAARMGDGWLFTRLRAALDFAAATGQPPWSEIARLAQRAALPDLYEFAAAMSLAEAGGAAVRSTLLAKADTLRTKALADAEAAAHHNSELLVLPTVALLVAFMLLIGFPGAFRIMGF